ncbi:MAG: GNAT family N-acetyltransferase [Saccharospirillaceae bacterium]|nr:GNAT family N-acetyltransferase [Saccharospirillaceae bacterium]MCD8532736.1 GNAT family N-acetyltransferase [Saccharospirillaceae bacterium]
MPSLRQAVITDIAEILRIQALCYTSIEPERADAFINKLQQAPDCAFVTETESGKLLAYLFALPIRTEQPPALDADDFIVPQQADCLYLHDLAIDPSARGLGLSAPLLEAFFNTAKARRFTQASLIAVQNSVPFWQRYGFHNRHPLSQDAELQARISVYGEAAYLTCHLA